MTDTERAALERRIDELCQEVEQLRTANAAFTGRSIRAGDKMACLEAENAKLRELCGRALMVIVNNCSECAYFYDCNIVNDCKCVAPQKIRDELRELGVTA